MVYHFAIAGFLTFLGNLLIAATIFFKNRRNITNRIFTLFFLAVSTYGFGFFRQALAQSIQEENVVIKILLFGTIFIPVFFVHGVYLICEKKIRKAMLYGLYSIGAVFTYINFFTNLLAGDPIPKFGLRYVFQAGPAYPLLAGFFGVCAYIALKRLYQGYRAHDGLKKNQLTYLFWGTFIGFCGGSVGFLLGYDIDIYPLNPFSSYAVFLANIVIAYAIVRHQLLEIEVVIRKTLVFASLFTIAFGIIVSITLVTQELIAGGRLFGLAIGSIIIIFAVRPLEDFLIRVTDKYLFQKKYDPLQLLKTFSDKVLASVLDKEAIIKIAVDLLVKALNLKTFAIMLANKEGDKYEISGSSGLEDKAAVFSPASHVITYLSKTFSPIIKKSHDKTASGELAHDMDRIKTELCIPLVFHKHLVGILAFGKKKSDQEYTNDDLNILVPLSRDIAIAIVYARLYEEIRQKDKLATMGTLVAGIKHEIGNPLSNILTSTQLIIKEMEAWDSLGVSQKEREEKFKNTLDEVLYESRRIGRITKKFTDFAKPGDESVKEIVNIEDSLNDALEILQNELNLKHIKIEKNIPEDTPSIFVDKDQAHQIFFNILRNAAQAIEESKKPREESMITITVEKKIPDSVAIGISDTGSGISEEKKKRIFEPFYTTKLKGKGTGLGLAIVRQLVGRNKGDISFKSREGEGTTFTVEFPVVQNG